MNSENEKLRALLQQALDMLEEQALHIEAEMQPAGKKLLNQIRAVLSQQAEPAPAQSYKDDPRMPAELSLAGCRCVRFGEGNPHWPCRIHTAPAQDELLIKLADFARFVIKCVRRNGEYAPASMQEPHEIETLLASAFADRPAQTEQWPVAWLIDWPDEPELGYYFSDEPNEHARSRPLYTAPIAQTEQWISVDAQLPESERTVLAYYLNSHGKGRRVRAEYIAAKTKSADDGWDSDEPADYDEQADEYFWPAGWYEVMDNWDDLTHMVIHEGEVTHWLPLPSPPTP